VISTRKQIYYKNSPFYKASFFIDTIIFLCRIKISNKGRKHYKYKKTKNMKREKGFTLIELLVVIAIIAILATLVLIALDGARDSARDADRKGAISQIRTASQLYASDPDHNGYSGMNHSELGVTTEVQDKPITINATADQFCASIQLSDDSYWCTDHNLGTGTGNCGSATVCP
jgi:prepilin-type N-terminal cleavage/methylation domain-containing protein